MIGGNHIQLALHYFGMRFRFFCGRTRQHDIARGRFSGDRQGPGFFCWIIERKKQANKGGNRCRLGFEVKYCRITIATLV